MEQGNTLFPRLDELESNIGVEQGFFDRLLHEDDWSFVIKLHAVFEAVVTHLLTYHFQEEWPPGGGFEFTKLKTQKSASALSLFRNWQLKRCVNTDARNWSSEWSRVQITRTTA